MVLIEVILIIWVSLILLMIVRVVSGWELYNLIKKQEWVQNLPSISHFAAKGLPTPCWWKGENKSPLEWFRNKLVYLSYIVLPFNLATFFYLTAVFLHKAKPIWKPEMELLWLIMTIIVYWGSAISASGQSNYLEKYLEKRRLNDIISQEQKRKMWKT